MTPDFVPVGISKIDWPKFLAATQQALGRSVSASLDAKRIPAQGLAPFPAAISEFMKEGSDPIRSLRNDRRAHGHVFVTMLVVCDREAMDELNSLGLALSVRKADPDGWVAIASGSMQQWFFALLDGLSPASTKGLRILLGKILLWFERNDLGEVWGNYAKRRLEDGTFVLESK